PRHDMATEFEVNTLRLLQASKRLLMKDFTFIARLGKRRHPVGVQKFYGANSAVYLVRYNRELHETEQRAKKKTQTQPEEENKREEGGNNARKLEERIEGETQYNSTSSAQLYAMKVVYCSSRNIEELLQIASPEYELPQQASSLFVTRIICW